MKILFVWTLLVILFLTTVNELDGVILDGVPLSSTPAEKNCSEDFVKKWNGSMIYILKDGVIQDCAPLFITPAEKNCSEGFVKWWYVSTACILNDGVIYDGVPLSSTPAENNCSEDFAKKRNGSMIYILKDGVIQDCAPLFITPAKINCPEGFVKLWNVSTMCRLNELFTKAPVELKTAETIQDVDVTTSDVSGNTVKTANNKTDAVEKPEIKEGQDIDLLKVLGGGFLTLVILIIIIGSCRQRRRIIETCMNICYPKTTTDDNISNHHSLQPLNETALYMNVCEGLEICN